MDGFTPPRLSKAGNNWAGTNVSAGLAISNYVFIRTNQSVGVLRGAGYIKVPLRVLNINL
jgi:hypothetical protein